MRPRQLVVVCVLSWAASASGQEQPPVPMNQNQYQGVTPGTPNPPPRLGTIQRARRPVVTWPGFQVAGQGSRIFVQTSAPVAPHEAVGQSRIVYRFQGCELAARNNRNPLDTSHFNTPVQSAFLRRAGRDIELVIDLRTPASPTVTTAPGENGFQFVFIEFTPGDYLPEGPPPVPEPRLRLRSSSRSRPAEPPAQIPAPQTLPMGPTP